MAIEILAAIAAVAGAILARWLARRRSHSDDPQVVVILPSAAARSIRRSAR